MLKRSLLSRLGALLVFGSVGAIMMPSCTIRIGKGGGTEDDVPTPDETQPAPDGTQPSADEMKPAPDEMEPTPTDDGTEDSSTFTPEEEAAIEAAHDADPRELALTNAKAAYAAYALSGLTEAQVADPTIVDEQALRQIIDHNTELAWQLAEQWIASLDPTTLSVGYPIKVECMDPPLLCQSSVKCPFADICVLNDCGDGRCRTCPGVWDLDNLIISGWCTYTCYVGREMVGAAITLKPRIGSNLVPWIQLCRPE
ncbi:hypothetical protein [Sorangium sp. So ce513]|uniref:hypothetical protein n=1 Tax=Sorangium sp. So ce513 TaxID=3133315 RepID=UPI003F631095